jgi:hypothetical protein
VARWPRTRSFCRRRRRRRRQRQAMQQAPRASVRTPVTHHHSLHPLWPSAGASEVPPAQATRRLMVALALAADASALVPGPAPPPLPWLKTGPTAVSSTTATGAFPLYVRGYSLCWML